MARNGVKTGGRNFKPGQSGNPAGSSKASKEVARAKRLNAAHVTMIISDYMHLTLEDLKEKLGNAQTPSIELMICRIMVQAIQKGDHTRLGFLFDRMIGKVTDKVQVSSTSLTTIERPDGSKFIMGRVEEDEDASDS